MHTHLYDSLEAKTTKRDFQTPPEVCRYMASLLPPGINTVLEPTPGDGNMVRALARYQVTAPEDFFLLPIAKYDAVVMNPPFSAKSAILDNAPADLKTSGMRIGYWFLQECAQRSDIVIALMPWFTISDSDLRLRYLMDFGLVSLTALPRKTFQYARIQTCIFELRRGFKGDTIFRSGRNLLYPHENDNLFT